MKHVVITNLSSRPLDEVMPILQAAYRAVKPEIRRPPVRPLPITLQDTRRRTWMIKWKLNVGQNSARLLFSKPGRPFHETAIDGIELHSMTEVILAVAACAFAAILVKPELGRSCAWCALREYRADPSVLDRLVERAVQAKVDRADAKFAQEVFDEMEQSSLEYKLTQIAAKEKVWLRKFRLADTKLKSLRRSRASLLAAAKRKQRSTEAQVADLPPTTAGHV